MEAAALIATGAALAAWIASRRGARRPIRLALTFVIAAFLVLPPPAAFAVALAAGVVGGPGSLAGCATRRTRALAGVAVAAGCAAWLQAAAPGASRGPALLPDLARSALVFALFQGASLALALLPVARALPSGRADRERPGALALEAVNVPLGWLLAGLSRLDSPAFALALAVIVLLAAWGLRVLDRALADLRITNDALAARAAELATLHAVGRELVSTLDRRRVFSILERECRKILPLDAFLVALVEPDGFALRLAYRALPSSPGEERDEPLAGGLLPWAAVEKRALRIDDFEALPPGAPPGTAPASPAVRSAVAVPLVVEERVVGVLSVQSVHAHAYDDPQVAVLATVAQQAAAAIDNARNYEMATVDSLTRLFVKDYFFRRLEEEHSRARRYAGSFAILMMDLDAFKTINDRHGHLVGDRYLRAVGRTIRARLRAADLACRYGGDEFCVLLPETGMEGAEAIAQRIRASVARVAVPSADGPVRATVSIGLASFPEHENGELRGLVLKADQALYLAKRAGRNRVILAAA